MSPPVLVALRALGLGDFLAGVPAYRALARAFPGHRRLLALPAALHALVPLADAFDGVLDAAPLGEIPPPGPVDVAVDLHGRGPESQRLALALAPRRLVAFAHAAVPESAAGATWRPDEHEVARWCRMLGEAGVPADPADLALRRPSAAEAAAAAPALDLAALAGAVVVHPGAASESRRWPADRWAEVARLRRRRGERVVITGGPDEAELARRVAAAAGVHPADVLAGRTPPLALAALVARAAAVASGDTGIAHLASAYGVPSAVLFGPIPPAEWGPPPRARHRAIYTGGRGDPHGTAVDPGLLRIGVEAVDAALDAALAAAPVRRGAGRA